MSSNANVPDDSVAAAAPKPPNEKTMLLAYEESTTLVARRDEWLEAMNNKIVAVFSFAAGLAGLATTFASSESGYIPAALVAFGITAAVCVIAYWPRMIRVSPDPKKLRKPAWLAIEPAEYQLKRLADLGKDFDDIRRELVLKARLVALAMITTAVEVVLFGLATL